MLFKTEKMNKNIWIFHHYADPPDGHWTGTFDLYKHLIEKGHSVTVFSSSFSHYSRCEERLKAGQMSREQFYEGVRFIFVKTPAYKANGWRRGLNMFLFGVRAYKIAKRLMDRPDIVVGSTPHPFCALAAERIAKRHGARFFLELHDLWYEYMIDTGVLSPSNPIAIGIRKIDELLYAKAECIMALWPKMHEYVAEYGIPREKVVWMPMGVDFNETKVSSYERKEGAPFVALCAARIGPASNVSEILEAAKILKAKGCDRIRFVILGDGPEKEKLVKIAEKAKLENIEFRGMVPKAEVSRHIAAADVCIAGLPDVPTYRKYGTIPTKLIDYISSNRPTVFIASVKDSLVERAKAGVVVPPNRPIELADAIFKLSKLPHDELREMGDNGLKYLKENHDLRMLADRLESLFEEQGVAKVQL